MKAIVQDRYGPLDALTLRDVDKPLVKDDEVLVRVRAASVHPDVWHVVSGRPFALRLMGAGLRRPKNAVPGTDLAGVVEAVGAGVTRFQPGDEVFGESLRGYAWANGGTYAQYVSAPAEILARKPGTVTFEQAASVPTSGLIAYNNLQTVRAGQTVLVNGAGGGVGSVAVQIAKALGAQVTGVDHPSKLDMVRKLGADHVIDYTTDDFTKRAERYDLVFDVPGNHSLAACRRVLTPDGKYVLIGHDQFGARGRRVLGSLPRFMGLMAMSFFVRQLPTASFKLPAKADAMEVLRELLEAGKLTPIVDRTFPLAEVPEAIRYLGEGNPRGKVVVTIP